MGFWTGISDPIAAKVKNLSEEDQKIYHLMVQKLREACERTGEKAESLDHHLVIKRVESWKLIKKQLRLIRSEIQAIRKQHGEMNPTKIEDWVTEKIRFINLLKEYDAEARAAMEVDTKQVSSATQKELETIFLGAIKQHLAKGKAQFDKDAKEDYLQKNPSCEALINRVRRNWDYLSVFSDPNWRHVTMKSNDISFLIVSGKKGAPLPARAEADGATKAIFTIREEGVREKAEDHIQATRIALAVQAFQPAELDSDCYAVPTPPAQRFFDVDPEGLRPVLQHYQNQRNADYQDELEKKLKARKIELSKFANRSSALVQLAISEANVKLAQRQCAYSGELKQEPATFLAWIWVLPKEQPLSQPTETITKIITVTKGNPAQLIPVN